MQLLTDLDRARLGQALSLASQSIGLSEPNPRVGCVIGNATGQIFGQGFTQAAGSAHAEVMALRDAQAAGFDVRGATVWVTLEPCAHHGRTPPCADALVRAGVARVVVAVGDPFPQVAGAGMARLRAAGIDVTVAEGELAAAARELNIGFFSRIERGRPWVRMKIAVTLDGRMALENGVSQWITGPEARADGHAWRRRAGAIVTGVGTVVADDPRLAVREVPTTVQPRRIVLDPHLRTPANSRVLAAPGEVYLVHAAHLPPDTRPDLSAPRLGVGLTTQGLDLQALLSELARQQVNELHLEGGARFNGHWLQQGLVDELLVYIAPRLCGPGLPPASLPTLVQMSDSVDFDPVELRPVGQDLCWRLRPAPVSTHLTDRPMRFGDGP